MSLEDFKRKAQIRRSRRRQLLEKLQSLKNGDINQAVPTSQVEDLQKQIREVQQSGNRQMISLQKQMQSLKSAFLAKLEGLSRGNKANFSSKKEKLKQQEEQIRQMRATAKELQRQNGATKKQIQTRKAKVTQYLRQISKQYESKIKEMQNIFSDSQQKIMEFEAGFNQQAFINDFIEMAKTNNTVQSKQAMIQQLEQALKIKSEQQSKLDSLIQKFELLVERNQQQKNLLEQQNGKLQEQLSSFKKLMEQLQSGEMQEQDYEQQDEEEKAD